MPRRGPDEDPFDNYRVSLRIRTETRLALAALWAQLPSMSRSDVLRSALRLGITELLKDPRRAPTVALPSLSTEDASTQLLLVHDEDRDPPSTEELVERIRQGRASALADAPELALRQRRQAAGLSQGQLGKLVGVSATTISQWERGQREPNPEVSAKLRQLLKLSPKELARRAKAKSSRKR